MIQPRKAVTEFTEDTENVSSVFSVTIL